MRHFLFTDLETDEDFIVGAQDMSEGYVIAKENFADPFYICEYTDMEAEMSGLDEY